MTVEQVAAPGPALAARSPPGGWTRRRRRRPGPSRSRASRWEAVKLARRTRADPAWAVRAARVYPARDGRPAGRTRRLIAARRVAAGAAKHVVSNAPPRTALLTLLKVAFTRAGVGGHVCRPAETEVGFGHFEGRDYRGMVRPVTPCRPVLLFAAGRTGRPRGGETPEVTIGRAARASNALCRAWLARRPEQTRVGHVASVIEYHQARDRAAGQSRQRSSPKRE